MQQARGPPARRRALLLVALLAAAAAACARAQPGSGQSSPRAVELAKLMRDAEDAAIAAGKGPAASLTPDPKVSDKYTAADCAELYIWVQSATNTALTSKGTHSFTIELSCPDPVATPVFNCYCPPGSTAGLCAAAIIPPSFKGNLFMAISGKATLTIKAANECKGRRPVITGAGPANITFVNGLYTNDLAVLPYFSAGTSSDSPDLLWKSQLVLQDIVIDGNSTRPCVAGFSGKGLELKNVDLVNCVGIDQGAAVFAQDTKLKYNKGTVQKARTYSVSRHIGDFRGAGGAVSQNAITMKGQTATFTDVVFTDNWHQNIGGTFYFTNYNQEAPAAIQITGGKGEISGGVGAEGCGVVAVYRADRFYNEAKKKLQMGTFKLNINVPMIANRGLMRDADNKTIANSLICTSYQEPVQGGATNMFNLSWPANKATKTTYKRAQQGSGAQSPTLWTVNPLPPLPIPNEVTESIWIMPLN